MTAISSLNTGLTLPADVSGYTLPTGALIAITDPIDTQESSVGTTKAVPVLRILDRTVSIQGGFNATTSTPNLQNSTGSSGNFYHVTVSGEHDLGDGTEFFAAGWDLLHDGTSFIKQYNIKNFIELNEGLTSPADTYGFVAESGDLFPLTDVNDTEFDPSGTQKSASFRNLSENILQYGLVTINEQRTSPGDSVGFIPDSGDMILLLDVSDTEYSSSGTVKGLKIGSLPSGGVGSSTSGVDLALFNPLTSTPNITNSAGAIGDLFYVSVTGAHDLGDGAEFFASGSYLLHNGVKFQRIYNTRDFIALNEDLSSRGDTYGLVADSGDLFPFTDVSDTEIHTSGTPKAFTLRNLSENVLQYGMATINEQRTLPGDAAGYIPDASDIILVLDVNDTEYSSSGTVKGLPVSSLPSGSSTSGVELALFNPQTDTPNLTNSAGNIGDLFHVTSSGGHDFGNGIEYLASGWDVLHDGVNFNTHRHLDNINIITPQMFGAKGDRATDDTTSIQAASDFCWAITTGTSELTGIRPILYFPPSLGYFTTSQVTVRRHIDVKMDGQILYGGNHTSMALSIGEAGLTNRDMDFKIDVFRTGVSDWASEESIGVRFINSNTTNISVNVHGFTIGAQCLGWGAGFAYNDVTFGRMINNKYHVDCTNNTAFAIAGWCNENTFRNGRFANDSNKKFGEARYGVRISSIDGTNLNNNHNVYLKLSHELNNAASTPADSVPYLIEAGNHMKIISNRAEGNGTTLAIVASGSRENEFEFQHQQDGIIFESGTKEGSSRLFHAENVPSKDARLVFDSDFIGETAVAYDATQIHIPKCDLHFSSTQIGVIAVNGIRVFETDAFIADIFTDEILVDHNRHNGDIIYVTGSDLPLGLAEDTKYHIVGVTGNERFKVSTSFNGTPVDITDSGTGRQVYFGRKGWVELVSSRAVGVRVATDRCKNFVIERNVFPGSGGRIVVTAYNASGWVLGDNPDNQYVKGNHGFFFTSSYGGSYLTSSDNEDDINIHLRAEVKSADISVAGGSKKAALRKFKIYSIDVATAPCVRTNYEINWEGQRFATQAPTTGVYEAPLTLWNSVPGGGQPMGWVCTTGGAPGIWAAMPSLI